MYYYPNNAGMPNYMASQGQVQIVQNALKGRPVSSLEEARAAQIDFDGSLFIFPDIAHNRIYTKQISMDGNASLKMYELTPIQAQDTEKNYVTREEFDNAVTRLKDAFIKAQGSNATPQEFNF